MKQLDTDDSKQPAFIVRMDAEDQHRRYWPLFPKAKQDLALRVKEMARQAYFRSKVYMNARDKFISVKVDRPQLADALQQADIIEKLKEEVDQHGVEMVATKNNLLFRIRK
jgi:hypothetical protein